MGESEEAGDVVVLGLLRPPCLPCYLGGVVGRSQRHEVLRSLFLQRRSTMFRIISSDQRPLLSFFFVRGTQDIVAFIKYYFVNPGKKYRD